jgi:hypothetical protein
MRAREFLSEALLAPGVLFEPKHLDWRPAGLLQKLLDKSPFVDPAGKQYIPAEGEYDRLKPLIDQAVALKLANPKAKMPSLTLNTEDEQVVPFSKLEKADLQTAQGQVTQKINVQPLGIGIAAQKVAKDVPYQAEIKQALENNQAIMGSDLHTVILNNTVLDQAGPVGAAIKKATTDIVAGQIPDLKDHNEKTQKVIAIDAGEYLGILQMVHGTADFPKNDQFLKFLGATDLNNLLMIFPGSQNAQLQDSYGVQNTTTGHTIMISSKGGIGKTAVGAAPAISGLKISDDKLKSAKPGSAVGFIKLIQSQKTIMQPFVSMNFLHQYYPESIPPLYQGILPFTTEDLAAVNNSISTGDALPEKFNSILASRKITARATPGGIAFYCVAKDLVKTVNAKNPIPDFRQTILEILDENFVQIFSRVVKNKLTAKVLWPGKIDGNVYLWTKAEAASPSSAGLSFKVTD